MNHPFGGGQFAVVEVWDQVPLSKAQLQQITEDLRLNPKTFGYAQPKWNGHSLSRHLAGRYQLIYSPRQCRRLISNAQHRMASGSVDTPLPDESVISAKNSDASRKGRKELAKPRGGELRTETVSREFPGQSPRPWSGFSDTYRQEKTLQRLRQLSVSGLPIRSFAASLLELLPSATNSGDAAQALMVGDVRDQRWILRDLATLEWTVAHMAEHHRANSDDQAISGMLLSAGKLAHVNRPVVAPWEFMGPRFHESPAYDELWRHHNTYSGVMNILRSNGRLVGFAPVWKSRKEKPFTQSDLNFLDKAVPLITHGVQMSQAAPLNPSFIAETTSMHKRAGIVTSDLKGRIVAIDERAKALFSQPAMLDGRPLDAFSSSNLPAGLKYVSAVIRQTLVSKADVPGNLLQAPAARVWWHSAGCVFLLRAVLSERLGRSPLVTILVEEHEPLAVQQQRRAIRYGMSPRESEIFHLAKAGTPRRDIAAKLDISPNTVKTYLRQVALKIAEVGQQRTLAP